MTLLSNRSLRIITFLYPLLFWALIIRLVALFPISSTYTARLVFLAPYREAVLYYGVTVTVVTVVWALKESIQSLAPYKQVRSGIPTLVKDLVDSHSQNSESALVSRIQGLLVRTRTSHEVRLMRIMSIFSQTTTKRHSRIIIPLYTLTNILLYIGFALVTIQVYYVLAPAFESALPWIDYISSSATAIVILLALISTINFGLVVEELQFPAWQAIFKAMKNPFLVILRILDEFTIATRLARAGDAIIWSVAFWGSYRGNVESPDNTTLTEIVQGSLSQLLGPSLVLFYRSETLYPTSMYPKLAALEENILQYLLERQPGAFIGIYRGKCVLIAYTSTEDVRRLSIWTGSSALTRNIVTKARKVLLELKLYEAN